MQSVIPLSDGSALRLTTSKYFTPLGKVIHEKGVIPDIVVEEGKIELAKEKDQGELAKPLEKAQEVFEQVEKKDDTKKDAEKTEIKPFDYKTDNQLIRAVDILKAMKFCKNNK